MANASKRLLDRLHERLPDGQRRALRTAVSLAKRQSVDLYLVGGAVRDLLLAETHLDLDFVVEGDALALATAVGERLDARVVTHPRFGTAAVEGADCSLDLAQARSESYPHPGALPIVRPALLSEDLARRDFSINAMALRLSGANAGELIDPHGGRRDLRARQLRVLHDESFQDDATRILRAVRYVERLQFRLERRTRSLLRRDASCIDTIGGARVRHELERIADEERVAAIVRLAAKLDLLETIHPALRVDGRVLRALRRLPSLAASHRDAVLFCLLLAAASPADAEGAIGRLALTGRQAAAAGGMLALRAHEQALSAPQLQPSEAERMLSARPPEAIEAFTRAVTIDPTHA
ncbi:MAG: hypothetical protein WD939_02270, partial [Dehalococcoidia bacterium]